MDNLAISPNQSTIDLSTFGPVTTLDLPPCQDGNNSTITPVIFNLSSFTLSLDDKKLLLRGLKFTPTPRNRNDSCYRASINDFCQRIKWSNHWYGKVQNQSYRSIISKPTAKGCPLSTNDHFEQCIDQIKALKFDFTPSVKNNMSHAQYASMSQLKNRTDLTIKEADKGSGVVILNSEFYIYKIEHMLSDTSTYSKSSITRDALANRVSKFVSNYKTIFTNSEYKALTYFDGDLAYMYGLPKIHKSTLINNAIANQISDIILLEDPEDLTFRPIVSCTNCPLSKANQLLDKLLRPFLQHLPYRLQDGWEYLRILPSTVPSDSSITTADITSLYTNVTHHAGICAITYFCNTYPDLIHTRFDKNFILDLLNFCLHNSFIIFNGKCYHQLSGVPMGADFSPSYCDLTVGYYELTLVQQIKNVLPYDIADFVLESYRRYLDDIVIMWRDSFGDFTTITAIFDLLDDNLTFIFEPLSQSTNFLDITITISEGYISTDIYHKSTDTFNYVPYKSNHPRHTKNNIPFCLAQRICGIVSDNNIRDLRLNEMRLRLAAKGYPKSVIQTGIDMALAKSRHDIIAARSTQTNDEIVGALVSTFNPAYKPPIKEIQDLINKARPHVPLFNKLKVINSYRQAPNLKRTLTLNINNTKNPVIYKCNRPRCKCCTQLIIGSQYTLKSGQIIKPNKNMCCTDVNLIYLLVCDGCLDFYIGESGTMVSMRINTHRDHSKPNPNVSALTCDKHFQACCGGKFRVFFIHKMPPGDSLSSRRCMEYKLIRTFKPKLNMD